MYRHVAGLFILSRTIQLSITQANHG